jgi:fluoroacetyl-CoA thioesterase
VIAVDGRRITLQVEAFDDQEKIGEGTHQRAIIDMARFAERLAKKKSPVIRQS